MKYPNVKRLDEKERDSVNFLRSKLVERAQNVPPEGTNVEYLGKSFWVAKGVFWPFEDSKPLVENFLINSGEEVLDVCTGSGVISIEAALRGAKKVVALDVNPEAIRSTKANAKKFGFENIIDARESDVFSGLRTDEKFNVITCNPPFTNENSENKTAITIKDKEFGVHKRFFDEVAHHLKPDGRIYFSQANFGNLDDLFELVEKAGFNINLIGERITAGDPRIFYAFELTLRH